VFCAMLFGVFLEFWIWYNIFNTVAEGSAGIFMH
jgi:uncharacterized membrane protein